MGHDPLLHFASLSESFRQAAESQEQAVWRILFNVGPAIIRELLHSTIQRAAQGGLAPERQADLATTAIFLMIDQGTEIPRDSQPGDVAARYLDKAQEMLKSVEVKAAPDPDGGQAGAQAARPPEQAQGAGSLS